MHFNVLIRIKGLKTLFSLPFRLTPAKPSELRSSRVCGLCVWGQQGRWTVPLAVGGAGLQDPVLPAGGATASIHKQREAILEGARALQGPADGARLD